MTIRTEHFNVHPSVVFKLGQDLITDDVQALAELVKNAYDADATRVIVRIITTQPPDGYPEDNGYVEIEDDGVGMDVETLISGWLTISNSMKRDMKAAGRTTTRGRTPMGDKGLGRLGAQRLGNRITITTSPRGLSITNSLSFDWRDFENKRYLTEVPVQISSYEGRAEHGTKIIISDLYDPEALSDRQRLRTELAKIISPYGEVSDFRLYVSVDGETLDLTAVNNRVRDAAAVRYTLSFDGSYLRLRGFMRLAQLRPNSKQDRATWSRLVDDDQGAGLLSYLMNGPEASVYKIRPARSKKWWLEFSHDIYLDAVKPKVVNGRAVTPGPFTGEIDSFNLSAGSVEEINVFNRASELRNLIREMHGIRIYRDGFNVRVAEDWLGLGKQVTSGASWYGLRPATTMGYIAITASGNAQLTETTDREGFNDTPAYENFRKLLLEFVDNSAKAQEYIGRGAVAYRNQYSQNDHPHEASTEDVIANLETTLNRATEYLGPLRELRSKLEAQASEADSFIDRYARVNITEPHELEMLEQLNRLSRQAIKAGEMLNTLETLISDMSRQQGAARRIQNELEMLGEQLTMTYETMAVGLTAESISHEIGNIAERLARRSTEIMRYVKRNRPDDSRLIAYVGQVQATVAGLRRQLAHLAPSLRYVRERREQVQVSGLVTEVREYFTARWDTKIKFESVIENDFTVIMNRGKLLQVIDNVILNSEYWLLEEVRLGSIREPVVTVSVDAPIVSIYDNGRGVDPQVEDALFEPFVSKKPRGAGRGLGLFIVRQLLDAEGCEIELRTTRNRWARRFAFDIDLTSVMVDG
jgi:signal transduction histidine kinase